MQVPAGSDFDLEGVTNVSLAPRRALALSMFISDVMRIECFSLFNTPAGGIGQLGGKKTPQSRNKKPNLPCNII